MNSQSSKQEGKQQHHSLFFAGDGDARRMPAAAAAAAATPIGARATTTRLAGSAGLELAIAAIEAVLSDDASC
jgi:hypothetical protein